VVHTTSDQLAKSDYEDDDGPGMGPVVTGAAGRDWRVAPSTARRLTCDCSASTMVDGPDGAALHLGRRSRRIKGRLRRAVHARDRGMYGTPGCTERATQIHHLRHWAHGGSTCLRNLISLCDGHHWAVHEGGFTLVPRSGGGWVLLSPEGARVGPTPEPHEPAEPLRVDPEVADDAVTGHWDGTKMNTACAVSAILGPQVPLRRTPKTVKAAQIGASVEQDVSAETWEPIPWPVHDDYPGQPWVGFDDSFFGWCNELDDVPATTE
jgi:hypothetical protein